jgi:glucosamine-6-phosphate deaminase
MSMIKEFTQDKLKVKIFQTRAEMGVVSAEETAVYLRGLLKTKEYANVIFAAAPSQNEFLAALVAQPDIDWRRVNAFHMDEYIGLSPDAPQGFGNFLRDRIFAALPFKTVNYLDSGNDKDAECQRYAALLTEFPPDIVCMGIGENGHIAFNDPHIAQFDDPALVKVVDLDLQCRMQQVNDGCFEKLGDVPESALTLTIPTLVSADYICCVVPAPTKAEAVRRTVNGDITEQCPASILRTHNNATLYLDADSGKYLV